MSSNEEDQESDEQQEEIDDQFGSDQEINQQDDEGNNVESDQDESNEGDQQDEDENEEPEQNPTINHDQQGEDDDEQTREDVDRTNPLDEDSNEAAQNLTQEDVFGEDLSESGGEENSQHNDISQKETLDEDLPEEQVEVTTPFVKCDLGREIHLMKLPSLMKIEPKSYNPQLVADEARDDDDEDSNARLKLKVENTIRWRYSTNELGELTRESNTRLVRWSDGSLSLHVGKEIFDVSKSNIQTDHNHLFVRHQKSMQAQALFRTKLVFRQHSNDSLTHLKIKFGNKANPTSKVRVLSSIKAQTISSNEMRKKEDQRLRTEERRRNQQTRQRERAANRHRHLSANYLEDRSEEMDDNNIESVSQIKSAVKKKIQKNEYRRSETIDDDDDDDQDELAERQTGKRTASSTKHRKLTSSDDDESNDDSTRKRSQTVRNNRDEDSD